MKWSSFALHHLWKKVGIQEEVFKTELTSDGARGNWSPVVTYPFSSATQSTVKCTPSATNVYWPLDTVLVSCLVICFCTPLSTTRVPSSSSKVFYNCISKFHVVVLWRRGRWIKLRVYKQVNFELFVQTWIFMIPIHEKVLN